MIFTNLFIFSATGAALASAAALPVYPRAANVSSYDLTSIKTHYMGTNSGLPGGTWPEAYKFNSTISFNIAASDSNTSCAGSWPYSSTSPRTNPVPDFIDCSDNGKTQWRFEQFTGEYKFRVGVLHYPSFDSAYTGATNVSSNSYATTNNVLTCTGGAPTTGITCNSNDQVVSIAVHQMPLKLAKSLSARVYSVATPPAA